MREHVFPTMFLEHFHILTHRNILQHFAANFMGFLQEFNLTSWICTIMLSFTGSLWLLGWGKAKQTSNWFSPTCSSRSSMQTQGHSHLLMRRTHCTTLQRTATYCNAQQQGILLRLICRAQEPPSSSMLPFQSTWLVMQLNCRRCLKTSVNFLI